MGEALDTLNKELEIIELQEKEMKSREIAEERIRLLKEEVKSFWESPYGKEVIKKCREKGG